MSEDLRSHNQFPYFHNFIVSDDVTTEILIPATCSRVSLGSINKDLFVYKNGATDAGTPPSNKGFIPKSNYLSIQIGKGLERIDSIFISSQSGSADVSVILEET